MCCFLWDWAMKSFPVAVKLSEINSSFPCLITCDFLLVLQWLCPHIVPLPRYSEALVESCKYFLCHIYLVLLLWVTSLDCHQVLLCEKTKLPRLPSSIDRSTWWLISDFWIQKFVRDRCTPWQLIVILCHAHVSYLHHVVAVLHYVFYVCQNEGNTAKQTKWSEIVKAFLFQRT